MEPVCKFVLDTGSTEEQQRWLAKLRAVSGTSGTQTTEHREYSFVISAGDEELKRIVIRYRSASAVHKKLQAAGVVAGLTFPGSVFDATKDFTRSEANWRQRAQDLEGYFTKLLHSQFALFHPVFKENFGFDFAELAERYSRVSVKVLKDPELLPRAMAFLGITGEILNPQYEHAPALAERVFLQPQWLPQRDRYGCRGNSPHTHRRAARTTACLDFRPRRPPSTTTIPRPIALPDTGSRAPRPTPTPRAFCRGSTLPRPTITDRVPTLPPPHTHTHTHTHFSG